MAEFRELAESIVMDVGGVENIRGLTHCVTRLRFKLRNEKSANTDKIKDTEGVVTVMQSGGQYQVVIGNNVTEVFDEINEIIGVDNHSVNEDSEKNEKLFDRFSTMISNIFSPLLGTLAATGTLKGLLSVLLVTGVLTETSGTYVVLYGISNTLFYFFPIFLGATAARYFKIDQYLGMAIGGSMIYPTLVALAGTTPNITFLTLPMNLIDYTSSVFPVIIAVWVASLLYKRIDKLVFQGIKFLLTPLIVLMIVVPLVLFVIGPASTFLSNVLSDFTVGVYEVSPVLGGLVLGGPWILIVMLGLHWAFIPIFILNVAINGSDGMLGLLTANMFAMAGATIAIAIKSNDKKTKEMSWSMSLTCLLGVAEPAIYGILLPLKKPLIMSVIGGSIGGAIAGFFQTKLYAFGGSALLQLPLTINPEGVDWGFYGVLIACAVAFVVTYILTYFFGYNKEDKI